MTDPERNLAHAERMMRESVPGLGAHSAWTRIAELWRAEVAAQGMQVRQTDAAPLNRLVGPTAPSKPPIPARALRWSVTDVGLRVGF